MPCAFRKLHWVELLVPIKISRMYAEKLCEFKVELKLEKLCDADGGVVCTHGEVRWVGRVGRWLSAREKWFHFFFRDASKSMLRSFVLLATVSLSVETPIDWPLL